MIAGALVATMIGYQRPIRRAWPTLKVECRGISALLQMCELDLARPRCWLVETCPLSPTLAEVAPQKVGGVVCFRF